jgi:hypothetical protein
MVGKRTCLVRNAKEMEAEGSISTSGYFSPMAPHLTLSLLADDRKGADTGERRMDGEERKKLAWIFGSRERRWEVDLRKN